MLFSSTVFLFVFLPIVLLVYFVLPRIFRNAWLLVSSLVFYAWGEPRFVLVMFLSIIINYVFALIVDANRNKKTKIKWIMAAMLVANLGLLCFFKYSNFFVDNINLLFNTNITIPLIPLPLGISFFTFQGISYVVDVYRKDGALQRNPLNMATYKTLFPQLIAGPIVRYQTVSHQITDRKETLEKFAYGTKRFIIGLGKKMFLANNCGWVADQIFAQNPHDMSIGLAWIGIIAYSLQIYFDFSGYSDMAIGLGKMFGFDFLENFNYPYISKSVTEFWRRWHISLGTWFRDYLYIPLGGNRISPLRTYINLFIVWFATGFWHGASWTFIAWGIYYGILIMLEKAFLGDILRKLPNAIQHIYATFLVVIGWVFFRSETFSYAFDYIKTMFGLNHTVVWDSNAAYYFVEYGVLIGLAIIGATPLLKIFADKIMIQSESSFAVRIFGRNIGLTGYYLLVLGISIICVVSNTFNPFIYFRF
ncbi:MULTISPECIES: MBOAT family protein [Bacillaceae]|uniref:Alginate O-acetyltransferase n=1 Tax=Gottfriedia luciferensis TaxID=178774 RepID=A0ABX2ZK41_9BACI|nr:MULTISPECIES: MBOAT family protein [Bacillaceae]ODG90083.1 alginate O-acetyltransferase [Gottfriedia luciferensis]PGZ91695.1 MBOAT family protein [Bacillus sp. AFS029533]SFD10421.1 alginate O-acetyltransferase complex protein AlgI [Bacillus sp. UNCCL81]